MGSPAFFTNHQLPQTEAWLSHLATETSPVKPSGQYVGYVNALIAGLIIDGNWYLLDRFWIFATEAQVNSYASIVNPNGLNAAWPTDVSGVNSPSWTSGIGYSTSGTQYLDTGYNPATNAVNYLANNCSAGYYNQIDAAESGASGVFDGTNYAATQFKYSIHSITPRDYPELNLTKSFAIIPSPGSIALKSCVKTSSSVSEIYNRGSGEGAPSFTNGAIPTGYNWYIFCYNGPLLSSFENASGLTRQYSMYFIGGGGINIANFYSRFQTFATAIGFQQ